MLEKQITLVKLLIEDKETQEIVENVIRNAFELGVSEGELRRIHKEIKRLEEMYDSKY